MIVYRNPYKLIFLFGKKGSGKSTYMVKYMIKYLKKGWNVYTDITDINIVGVRIIHASDLETFTPEKHSAIFLDEVGLTYDNRKFKTFKDGVNEWYKYQRKYKCLVYCNSQSWDIDIKLRTLCDRLILIQSIGGVLSIARPIKRTITLTEPSADAESRIADRLEFESIFHWEFLFLPRYFRYFNSFDAPYRPNIPYDVVIDGVKVLRTNPNKLKRNYKKNRGG